MENWGQYSEMVSLKYKNAVVTPLICAWEFIKRPKLQTWEKDWNEINKLSIRYKWSLSIDFQKLLKDLGTAILITDVNQQIRFASSKFEKMTGYSKEEVLGRKPNFLQGKDTDFKTNERIRLALKCGEEVAATVLNYKKEGTPYHCQLHIQPVYNKKKKLVNFLAIEKPVELPK
ncbi:MAG: PAS domain-containing protein [Opitutaceae bacterium]|nr:PAS domain-containing protein [Cytophagales bacterium]